MAVRRQVQIEGPDAARLTQCLCCRDLSAQSVGQGTCVVLRDYRGVLINDRVALKIADDRSRLSIGDSGIWLWASAGSIFG